MTRPTSPLTWDELTAMAADVLLMAGEDLTPEDGPYVTPGWDSQRHVELFAALETRCGRTFEAREVFSTPTLGKILTLLTADPSEGVGTAGTALADPAPASAPNEDHVSYGLRGVVADDTEISRVDSLGDRLIVRGRDLIEEATARSFENAVALTLGRPLHDLPAIDPSWRAMEAAPENPLVAMQLAVLAAGSQTSEADYEWLLVVLLDAVRWWRGANTTTAAPNAPLAQIVLDALGGTAADDEVLHVFENTLSLQVEHGANASSFTARVVASTGSDVSAAVASALAAFGGWRHGGATADVDRFLAELAEDGPTATVAHWKGEGRPMPGFGHSVYRAADPRATSLRDFLDKLAMTRPELEDQLAGIDSVRDALTAERRLGVAENVDLYAGIVYDMVGIASPLHVATFALSRLAGWVAHVHEQVEHGFLIRPDLRYVGQ